MELQSKLRDYLISLGVSDVGFSKPGAEGWKTRPMPLLLW